MNTGQTSQSMEVWGGIECTINRVENNFFDQLEYANHYQREEDIEQIAALGIKKLRYPILWEKHQSSLYTDINWRWAEERLNEIQKFGIEPIVGLVHHGSGPAFTNLADKNFPEFLARYAAKLSEKFPWIEYYTPVNEPLTTARFSGLYGIWYPHKTNDKSFMQMLLNQLKGTVLSMKEIRKINPQAKLVQTEDLGKTYSTKKLAYQSRFENERRWLTYDFLCGKVDKHHPLWNYFKWLGLNERDLFFFKENICVPDVFGFNHYITSERFLDERLHLYPKSTHGGNHKHKYADVEAVRVEVEEPTGIEVLIEEAWKKYKKPIAVTEVHLHCHREEQLRWFKHVWNACSNLKAKNIDIRAVTSWAMLGSYGWNKLLTEPNGEYEPGVFDLRGGSPRKTALSHFIKQLNTHTNKEHPLLEHNGWWCRPERFFQKKNIISIAHNRKSQPILITGKTGTLGRAFSRLCEDRCIPYILLSRQDCDISQKESIEKVLKTYKPWAVINTAGYVRVDDAEKEADRCFQENTVGAAKLAIACAKGGIKYVSFSSDLVFDGEKKQPYTETDAVNPLNVYGKSKADAEKLILENAPESLVIRTSAFFGPWDEYNFLHWVISSLNAEKEVLVANDIFISPTYVPDLVHSTLDLLVDDERGIWHLANGGSITWAELAHHTAEELGLDLSKIKSVSKDELGLKAKRPSYSVLHSNKAVLLPSLENALERFFVGKKELVNL